MKNPKKLNNSKSGKLFFYVSNPLYLKYKFQDKASKLKHILKQLKIKNEQKIIENEKNQTSSINLKEDIKLGFQKIPKIGEMIDLDLKKNAYSKSESFAKLKKKKDNKIKKITKFRIESGKPHCFLYRIRKINPEINLDYKLELYTKKQRYSSTKDDELIDDKKYRYNHFLRKKFKEKCAYRPTLSQQERNNFFLQNKKSISSGMFRSITNNIKRIPKNILNYNNSNYNDYTNLYEDNENMNNINNTNNYAEEYNASSFFLTNNKKISTKYSTKTNTIASNNSSKVFSRRLGMEINNRNNLNKSQYFYLKLKEIKNKIHETFDKANNASMELNQNIINANNYDKLFCLSRDENYLKKKDYKQINENKNKLKTYLFKYIGIKKDLNRLPGPLQYLDKEGKKILFQAREIDEYNQNFLHKNQSKKNFELNSKFYVNKLIGELNELGQDILATKKKYKGEDAIEPKNEKHFFHELIQENQLKYLSDDNYFEEVMRRKNIAGSLDNRAERRLFLLKQKSLAKRHKLGKNDYNYI